jgi:hypothetical protein
MGALDRVIAAIQRANGLNQAMRDAGLLYARAREHSANLLRRCEASVTATDTTANDSPWVKSFAIAC